MNFKEKFALDVPSVTDEENVILKGNVRISVLTDCLVRIEYSKTAQFVDKPTQKVWYRNFEKPKYTIVHNGNHIVFKTEKCEFSISAKNGSVAYVVIDGEKVTSLNKGNLKGTYRTLDQTVGATPMCDGVVSENGTAVFDDSNSLLLNSDGTISPRPSKESDNYIFAYGKDYRGAVRDFIRLTGNVPLVPRFCLGNWWSRYKAYTQEEYVTLMERFIKEEIPITVATIDMDWHWVDVKGKFKEKYLNAKLGSGWTGYSWNTDLFPDYKGFLKWLHEKNFKVTMNLHPADGVHCYEDMYKEFAEYMGVDPKSNKCIPFDCTDPKYMEAYFDILHHPYEKDGVDFWWLDWQQGKHSKLKGLDPLWALNHYHYMDSNADNKRGLILSRFAEPGSQRYPLGFSGDTMVSWGCYKFQPYSTATASNIGYTWWSHDIGGHHMAKKDDELYIRWVQFGVFSPINRLHSTSNEFMGKEPWKFRYDAQVLATKYLRLRHQLIPYLYAMNYRTYKNQQALMEPMYYEYPNREEAYNCPNQYLFGSELIVAAITEPVHPKTNLASVKVWLPEGRYTDVFNNRVYNGNQVIEMYRGVESTPVLAKAGAIIPLDENDKSNRSENPTDMEILVYRGNNSFELYEDDGETKEFENGKLATTKFEVAEVGDTVTFAINPADGDLSVVPQKRNYTINFKDIVGAKSVDVLVNDKPITMVIKTGDNIAISLENISPSDNVKIILNGIDVLKNNHKEEVINLVTKYQLGVDYKKKTFMKCVSDYHDIPNVKPYLKKPLEEIARLK